MSQQAFREMVRHKNPLGISYAFVTAPGGYRPLHWHDEIELYFSLNGDVDITVEGTRHKLPRGHLLVVDSGQIHSFFCHDSTFMYLSVLLDPRMLQELLPDAGLYRIHCYPQEIPDELLPYYLEICRHMETLVGFYMREDDTHEIEAPGILLQVYAQLLQHFSTKVAPAAPAEDRLNMNRIRQVITYVEEHFREQVALDEIAGLLGIGREYFCRFFRKNMGMTFLQYVNEVRIAHIYRDLIHTEMPIAEIMERNGFTNQKLFNRLFRTIYGCTPSSVRKGSGAADPVRNGPVQ